MADAAIAVAPGGRGDAYDEDDAFALPEASPLNCCELILLQLSTIFVAAKHRRDDTSADAARDEGGGGGGGGAGARVGSRSQRRARTYGRGVGWLGSTFLLILSATDTVNYMISKLVQYDINKVGENLRGNASEFWPMNATRLASYQADLAVSFGGGTVGSDGLTNAGVNGTGEAKRSEIKRCMPRVVCCPAWCAVCDVRCVVRCVLRRVVCCACC
jgi:hypothetical protein